MRQIVGAWIGRLGLLFGVCVGMALGPLPSLQAQEFLPPNSTVNPRSGQKNVPPAARIHTELGAMYFQQGNIPVALEELYLALDADPNYAPAYNVRGLVHAQIREMKLARKDFETALRLTPQDPNLNNNFGWFLCDQGEPVLAQQYFAVAIRNPLYETPDRAYANAGACALKAGDLAMAESLLTKALSLSPEGGGTVRVELARLQFQKRALPQARRLISEALQRMEPPTADALALAVRIERAYGDARAEQGYWAQLRSRYPMSKELQDLLDGK